MAANYNKVLLMGNLTRDPQLSYLPSNTPVVEIGLAVNRRFKKQDGEMFHFWGTELQGNHVDTVWPYWNLMDFTPEGRPDIQTAPQRFRSKFLEENFLNQN